MSSTLSLGDERRINPVYAETYLSGLPAALPADPALATRLSAQVRSSGRKVVVIDDDPTGCQTVHDVPMWLEWSVEALEQGLRDEAPALFVLTNSRAMDPARARQINAEVAGNLRQAAENAGVEFVVVSRSDSTLRGHFPDETDVLAEVLGPYDGVVISPCFFEAGRHTIHGVHWVRQGNRLTPAAQTESAADPTFGFAHSYLLAWIAEKTAGRVSVADVLRIDVDTLRSVGVAGVAAALRQAQDGQPIVVDAAEYGDLELLVAGLLEAEAAGQRFLYRTAASFVRVRAGVTERPLLRRDELRPRDDAPGLVAVGSFVPRSTVQLAELLDVDYVAGVELDAQALWSRSDPCDVIAAAIEGVCDAYDRGKTPVVYTSRRVIKGHGPLESLRVMNVVSDALVDVVRQAMQARRFGFMIAKGGITSHELAFKALAARRTRVLGQVAAGVPVWRLGPESVVPGLPYVVFPGNVGEAGTLRDVVAMLRGQGAT